MPANPHRQTVARLARRRGLTRTQRLHFERAMLHLDGLRDAGALDCALQALVPEAWDTLERDVDVAEKKTRVTLYLDGSVAQFYRATGEGYQARINRILATFAAMRLAELRRLGEMSEDELAEVAALRA